MHSWSLSGLIALSGLVACGGGPSGGFASPEKAAEALAKAFSTGDAAFCEQALPGPDVFLSVMDCPAEVKEAMVQGMTADREAEVAECVSLIERVVAERAGYTVTVKTVTTVEDEVQASAGEEQRNGCKTSKDIRAVEAEVTMTFTKDDESEEDSAGMEFIAISNRYYGGI